MGTHRKAAITAMSKRAKILIVGATVAVAVLAGAIAVIASGSRSTSRAARTPAQERAASRGIAQAKEMEGEVRAMEDANAEGLSYTPLPRSDAEGYIEGPVEYTDHGLRIHLNAEQASNPVEETEGDLYLQVRPKAYTRQPAVQSPQETQEMSDSELREELVSILTVHLKTSNFQNSSDSSCTSQAIPEATGVTAQICTLGSVSGAEVLDENANLLATQIEGNPTTMYREMVEVLPALVAEQSESTPTTQTESTETTPTTSTPEKITESPASPSSSNETACGDVSRDVTRVRAEGVSCATARSLAHEVSQSGAANKPPAVPEGCLPNNQTTSTGSCVVEGYHCRSESVHAEASEAVCQLGNASVKFRNGPPGE